MIVSQIQHTYVMIHLAHIAFQIENGENVRNTKKRKLELNLSPNM